MSELLPRNVRRRLRQALSPKVKSGPVNRNALLASACAGIAWLTWPDATSDGAMVAINLAADLGTLLCGAKAIALLIKDYQLRRALARSEAGSLDHGSARQSTAGERAARGMSGPAHGELLGLDDEGRAVWRPEKAPFMLMEAPPGIGKTAAFVVGSILHRAQLGYSVVVPDVKAELAVMLAPQLRALGYDVRCVNPAGKCKETVGETIVNPYQPLIDAVFGGPDARKDAVKLAADYAALHRPMSGREQTPYFGHGARRALLFAILSWAVMDPVNCTPTNVYALLTDPAKFLQRCTYVTNHLETAIPNDPIVRTLKGEARNLLYRADKNEENFGAFLEDASQRLISFNPAGQLGDYGRGAIDNLIALRERQVILFIMTPLSHMREFSEFISLLNHNIIAACKARPDGHPIHIVGEEALNYCFQDLVSDLETMRQLGVTADFYVQSFAGLERHYGREAAAAIEAYADVRIYGGLNTLARAKYVSDMLAQETVVRQDVSYRSDVKDLGLADREMPRPLMSADEILAMPRDQAWAFVRGMRPVRIRLVTYAQVSPWRDWVGASPITGTRLHAEPILHVDYETMRGRHDKG